MSALWERNLVYNTVPISASLHIQDFCRKIRGDRQPVFLEIEPDPSALPRECYFNVEKRCERLGGTLEYGWAIWHWPRVWLKAEHHAVWKSSQDELIDITPQKNGPTRVLFLPDDSQKHDPTGQQRIMPIVRALGTDRLINDAIEAERAMERYEEEHTLPFSRKMRINESEYEHLELAKTAALFRLQSRYTRKSQPCPCQSGLKFQECHLPMIRIFLEKWDNENNAMKS